MFGWNVWLLNCQQRLQEQFLSSVLGNILSWGRRPGKKWVPSGVYALRNVCTQAPVCTVCALRGVCTQRCRVLCVSSGDVHTRVQCVLCVPSGVCAHRYAGQCLWPEGVCSVHWVCPGEYVHTGKRCTVLAPEGCACRGVWNRVYPQGL